MEIYYLDNSGFAVILGKTLLVFDYYNENPYGAGEGFSCGVLPKGRMADFERVYFFVSHRHYDHCNRAIFTYAEENPNTTYILDVGMINPPKELDVHRMGVDATWRDDFLFVRRCPSTDIGGSFYVEAGGYRLFHAGDLNCWHWHTEATEDEERQLRQNFTDALGYIARFVSKIDVAFFPIDTRLKGPFDDGALEFIETFHPALFIPMHFQNDFDVPENFAAKVDVPVFQIRKRGDRMVWPPLL